MSMSRRNKGLKVWFRGSEFIEGKVKKKKQKEVEGKEDTESESEKEEKVQEDEEVEEDEQDEDKEDEEKQDEEEQDEEEEEETSVGEDSNSSTSGIPTDTKKREKVAEMGKKQGANGDFDGGFIFSILAWAYEVIPTLSTPPNFFATRIFNEVPGIINWVADTQPEWKDLKQKVFDSPTLEVSPMLATPTKVGMPYFAPFIEIEKDILKEAEDEL
uniref:Protein Ycf2-like n=1 Tax=Cucumis melo TaxID=3656 RepID=A0A9I9ELC4_CUCME